MPDAVHPDADGLVGSVTIWPSDILPGAKYRFCEGGTISRTEFSLCFARLGTKHGTGDGSTTFTLPNYEKRFLVGADAGDAAYDVVGDTGGAESGSVGAHTHSFAATTSTESSFSLVQSGSGINVADNPHTHSVSGTSGSGGGGSIATVPPYTVVRYVIKIA